MLIVDGDQFPVIPLDDVPGKTGIGVTLLQIGPIGSNAGVIIGVILIGTATTADAAHWPGFGVNV